jgi:hypothetical protein
MGLRAGARGSEKSLEIPAFRAVPAADEGRKKNVPKGETGGAGSLERTRLRWLASFPETKENTGSFSDFRLS